MGFTDWLGLATKKSKERGLPEDNGKSAVSGKTTVGTVDPILEDPCAENCLPKILMVQDGEYSSQLAEYAIRMASRLAVQLLQLISVINPCSLQVSGRCERVIVLSKKHEKTGKSLWNLLQVKILRQHM